MSNGLNFQGQGCGGHVRDAEVGRSNARCGGEEYIEHLRLVKHNQFLAVVDFAIASSLFDDVIPQSGFNRCSIKLRDFTKKY
jgi:hypothetical protein